MNPPFSAVAHVDRTMKDAALRHIASALARLESGGRLVAITSASCAPDAPAWRDAFARLQETGRVLFTAAIDGKVYAKHGTRSEEHTSELQSLMPHLVCRLPLEKKKTKTHHTQLYHSV